MRFLDNSMREQMITRIPGFRRQICAKLRACICKEQKVFKSLTEIKAEKTYFPILLSPFICRHVLRHFLKPNALARHPVWFCQHDVCSDHFPFEEGIEYGIVVAAVQVERCWKHLTFSMHYGCSFIFACT